jgi:hypothetical protein
MRYVWCNNFNRKEVDKEKEAGPKSGRGSTTSSSRVSPQVSSRTDALPHVDNECTFSSTFFWSNRNRSVRSVNMTSAPSNAATHLPTASLYHQCWNNERTTHVCFKHSEHERHRNRWRAERKGKYPTSPQPAPSSTHFLPCSCKPWTSTECSRSFASTTPLSHITPPVTPGVFCSLPTPSSLPSFTLIRKHCHIKHGTL